MYHRCRLIDSPRLIPMCLVAITFATCGEVSPSNAAVVVWSGPPTGGDFQDSANWSVLSPAAPPRPPEINDLVIIDSVEGTITYSADTALMQHTFFQGEEIKTTLDVGVGRTHKTSALVVVGSDSKNNQDLDLISGNLNVGTILIIGSGAFANNSDVTITGPNSVLRTSAQGIASGGVFLGTGGQSPTLTIKEGAKLIDTNATAGLIAVGLQETSNGLLTVTDPGSSLSTLGALQVGSNNDPGNASMFNNQVKVLNGGTISANRMQVGILESGKQNTVTVSGAGSVLTLTSAGDAPIGWRSTDNTLIVEEGGLIDGSNQFIAGIEETSTGNAISILSGGRINGSNFDMRRGAATITNGSLFLKQYFSNTMMAFTGGKIIAKTDPAGTITFNSGTIESVGAEIDNDSPFVVGDGGASSATYRMVQTNDGENGDHSFVDGLTLSSNATLSGDGNIVGNVSGSAGAKVQVGAAPGIINVTGDWNNTGIGISLELDNLGTSVVPGEQFDQLNVSGLFTHGGSVAIDRSQLVAPATTQQLKLIGWSSTSGLPASTAVSFIGGSPLTYDFLADGLYVTVQASAGTPGDYNNNGVVDAADYVVWRNNQGSNATLPNNPIPGTIGPLHYSQWRANFGKPPGAGAALGAAAVPEPTAWLLMLGAIACAATQRRGLR